MDLQDISNPKQTVLVSCREEQSSGPKDNIITIDWHMPCSSEPPLYAIAIGKKRYSLGLIRASGCFVVNFISESQSKEALFCGRHSGLHIDKFKECNFTKKDASTIDCAYIGEACAHIECEIEQEIDTGNHILLVARVTNSNIINHEPRLLHIQNEIFGNI